jgi:TonB family protein
MQDGLPMLLEVGSANARRNRMSIYVSVGIHLLLVILLLHGRSPVFVAPSSVVRGANGSEVTPLYWAPDNAMSRSDQTKVTPEPSLRNRLTWKPVDRKPTKPTVPHSDSIAQDQDQIAAAAPVPARAAGSPYGSLTEGPSTGLEIRPALPIATSEPLVGLGDLQGIIEGNVVVEITIDESGNIVAKSVVQSMGGVLDARVLAALESWHFRPATRDGVPIPSKQDVVYHFKPR